MAIASLTMPQPLSFAFNGSTEMAKFFRSNDIDEVRLGVEALWTPKQVRQLQHCGSQRNFNAFTFSL